MNASPKPVETASARFNRRRLQFRRRPSILPLSPRWEDERRDAPPRDVFTLKRRMAALRERLAGLEVRHEATMVLLCEREAGFNEASSAPPPVEVVEPRAHRRPGPYFEGAGGWTGDHGIDWLAEGKAARAEMYADVNEDTWASVEAARELGPEAVVALDPPPKRRAGPVEAPSVAEVVAPEPVAEATGQLLLFPLLRAPAAVQAAPSSRNARAGRPGRAASYHPPRGCRSSAPRRVPPSQLALPGAPTKTGPPGRAPRLNLLRAA